MADFRSEELKRGFYGKSGNYPPNPPHPPPGGDGGGLFSIPDFTPASPGIFQNYRISCPVYAKTGPILHYLKMEHRKTKLDPRTAYNYGVRCPATRAANAEYIRRWEAMRKMQAARKPAQLLLAGLGA